MKFSAESLQVIMEMLQKSALPSLDPNIVQKAVVLSNFRKELEEAFKELSLDQQAAAEAKKQEEATLKLTQEAEDAAEVIATSGPR